MILPGQWRHLHAGNGIDEVITDQSMRIGFHIFQIGLRRLVLGYVGVNCIDAGCKTAGPLYLCFFHDEDAYVRVKPASFSGSGAACCSPADDEQVS